MDELSTISFIDQGAEIIDLDGINQEKEVLECLDSILRAQLATAEV